MKNKLNPAWIVLFVILIYILLNTFILTPLFEKIQTLWQ